MTFFKIHLTPVAAWHETANGTEKNKQKSPVHICVKKQKNGPHPK